MAANAIPVYGVPQGYGGPMSYAVEVSKTASYSMLVQETGTIYTNGGAGGAITFTLPAITPGLSFAIMVTDNQNVTLASKEGSNILTYNNASASSMSFQTPGQLLGGHLRVWTNQAGTKWFTEVNSLNAVTIA